jgi:hypothetical protein
MVAGDGLMLIQVHYNISGAQNIDVPPPLHWTAARRCGNGDLVAAAEPGFAALRPRLFRRIEKWPSCLQELPYEAVIGGGLSIDELAAPVGPANENYSLVFANRLRGGEILDFGARSLAVQTVDRDYHARRYTTEGAGFCVSIA